MSPEARCAAPPKPKVYKAVIPSPPSVRFSSSDIRSTLTSQVSNTAKHQAPQIHAAHRKHEGPRHRPRLSGHRRRRHSHGKRTAVQAGHLPMRSQPSCPGLERLQHQWPVGVCRHLPAQDCVQVPPCKRQPLLRPSRLHHSVNHHWLSSSTDDLVDKEGLGRASFESASGYLRRDWHKHMHLFTTMRTDC